MMKGVTLRGLEVFEALAKTGSVAQAAQITGLSQPAVSQQLRNLETALGKELVDHARRPMKLTPAGQGYLSHAEAALSTLRLGKAELATMDLAHISALTIGMIDDFDNDITPRLATILAESLTRCQFKLITAPSHEIAHAMENKKLHIAVSASTGSVVQGVLEYPIVRDPFILVAPRGYLPARPKSLTEFGELPFMRYDRSQLIGTQIDAWLARQQLNFPARFEVGAHHALMAMVARGIGWSITTPLGYIRAARFHDAVQAYPLPAKPFSRTISLFAGADWAGAIPRDIGQAVRGLITSHMIDPGLAQMPWLSGEFRTIEG